MDKTPSFKYLNRIETVWYNVSRVSSFALLQQINAHDCFSFLFGIKLSALHILIGLVFHQHYSCQQYYIQTNKSRANCDCICSYQQAPQCIPAAELFQPKTINKMENKEMYAYSGYSAIKCMHGK